MAWKSGEIKRRKVTFHAAQIPGDLTDFVSWVDFSAYHTGADIFVTKSDGTTEIPREQISGQVWSKYSGVLSGSIDTDVYFYYGSGASDYAFTATYGRNNVWTLFEMVLHLLEDASGTGTSGLYVDSTGNGNDGDDYISATGKTGQIGDGQEFDGTNDYIGLASANFQGISQGTVVFWVNNQTTNKGAVFNHGAATGTSNIWIVEIANLNTGNLGVRVVCRTGGADRYNIRNTTTTMSLNTWYHCAVSQDGGGIDIYINGSAEGLGVYGGSSSSSHWFSSMGVSANHTRVGVHRYNGIDYRWYDGYIDELWVSNTALSANYITALYNNQNAPGTFYTIGPEETPPSNKRHRTSTWI